MESALKKLKWPMGCLLSFLVEGVSAMGMTVSHGQASVSTVPYRVGLLWEGKQFPLELGTLGVFVEASGGIWRSDTGSPRALTVVTAGPLLRWQGMTRGGVDPFLEIGIGFSWLSHTTIQGRRLSLHFQFEDKIGAGIYWGGKQPYEIAVRAYHYSNASLMRPNSGVNLWLFSIGKWW